MWKNYSQAFVLISLLSAEALGQIWDGRVPLSFTEAELDSSADPFNSAVKGTEVASHYTTLLGDGTAPTPLWDVGEQAVSITIDSTSIFSPGGGNPQNGFRRTELIAKNSSVSSLNQEMETGTTLFHFSIKLDEENPLNYTHEYQIVFIEPSDGSHVWGVQLGSPFTIPTGNVPVDDATSFKVLDHSLNVLFDTPFTGDVWHNFGVRVDWSALTLQVSYSTDEEELQEVTEVVPNEGVASGSSGQGDFHFGVLKLPLADPTDTSTNQADVVHYGIQEDTKEGILYSGVFVEVAS